MQMLMGRTMCMVSLVILFWSLPTVSSVANGRLSSNDIRTGKAAFQTVNAGDRAKASLLAERLSDPLAKRLLFWVNVTQIGGEASFETIADFITAHPDWPSQILLRQRAEEAMTVMTPISRILVWFDRYPPLTAIGKIKFGEALLARGETDKGQRVLRDAWINGTFTQSDEEEFLTNQGYLLTSEDHTRRLDRLLWDGRVAEARRMYSQVSMNDRALAEVRLRLRSLASDADAAIAQLPEALRQNPGLLYERLRWARTTGRDLEARDVLAAHSLNTVRPDLWWAERSVLARKSLSNGLMSEAYRIAKEHALVESAEFADAEWLAGWIALRFLSESKVAFNHFVTMVHGVKFPVSRARGAYWAGRAAQAANQFSEAEVWYRTAAQYPTNYYGQLAAAQLEPKHGFYLPPDPRPTAAEIATFKKHELVRAVRMLASFEQKDWLRPFIMRLAELNESAGWQALVAALIEELGRPDLAVAVAKQALRYGRPLITYGYPSIQLPSVTQSMPQPVEVPLVLAIVRQESAFNSTAVSPAGARGLMQLIPGTARHVAAKLNLRFSERKLTSDPDYNLKLGQFYISDLLETFDGSYVLALAAYNAGPARVREWISNHGDPRESVIDAIDWIEMIPYSETRNYVQRTLENLQVYRAKLNHNQIAYSLEGDLRR